jgi:hypothetical protein
VLERLFRNLHRKLIKRRHGIRNRLPSVLRLVASADECLPGSR